jgi:prevent-host-death family protein
MATTRKRQSIQGRSVEAITSTEAKNAFGAVLDKASRVGIVAITKHDKPSAVLLSIEAYEKLLADRKDPLAALRADFDRRIEQMQTPQARAGVKALFKATPSELGRAAVKGARKRG